MSMSIFLYVCMLGFYRGQKTMSDPWNKFWMSVSGHVDGLPSESLTRRKSQKANCDVILNNGQGNLWNKELILVSSSRGIRIHHGEEGWLAPGNGS